MGSKLKIVEIIPSLKLRGGAEVFFYNLCKEFIKRPNIELYVIILHNDVNNSFDISIFNNFYTCCKTKKIDFFAASNLTRLIREIMPDIIHTHLSCLATYLIGNFFAKKNYIYIHTVHSVPTNEANFPQREFNKLFFASKKRALIGISDEISFECKKIYKSANIITIYNGIPISKNKCPILKKEFDLICVARFSPVKNHLFLLKCFKKLLETNNSLKLICVGGGELLPSAKKYCETNGLTDSVFFTGYVDDPTEYLKKSKYFVLTSLYEGNPISVLEALSFGLPVIAPKVGGLVDIIDENVGMLFEPCSLLSFLESFNVVSKNGSDFYKQNCTNLANRYSIETCADNYFHAFLSLLPGGKK